MSPPPTSCLRQLGTGLGSAFLLFFRPRQPVRPPKDPPWVLSLEVKHPFLPGVFRGAGGSWFASLVTSSLSQVARLSPTVVSDRGVLWAHQWCAATGTQSRGSPGVLSHGNTGRGISIQSLATETGPLGRRQSPPHRVSDQGTGTSSSLMVPSAIVAASSFLTTLPSPLCVSRAQVSLPRALAWRFLSFCAVTRAHSGGLCGHGTLPPLG